MDESTPNATAPTPTSLARQTGISTLGEIAGLVVSIGAVYGAEYLAPHQTRGFIQRLARALSHHRGESIESQFVTAHKIADFAIMNVGGMVNMSTQFALHRYCQSPEERPPLGHGLGRVLAGRLVGTVTAGSALVLAECHAPQGLESVKQRMGTMLGNHRRLGELTTSSVIQSAGALPGNVAAQLLYDRLTGNDKSRA